MEDRQQWLSMAAVVLVILGLGYFLFQRSRVTPEPTLPDEGVNIEEKAQELMNSVNYEVPEGAEKATLKDVTGGEGTGIATRTYEDGRFEYTVIAGLPDLEKGFYAGYLLKNNSTEMVYTGKLRIAKGGYILEYTSNKDLMEYKQVRVTLELTDDGKPETTVLEGSF